MAGRRLPDKNYVQVARSTAGAALGAVLAGLPVLWGQIGPPVILSAGLALFWTFLVVVALVRYGKPARVLLLAALFAWMWTVVAAWWLWA